MEPRDALKQTARYITLSALGRTPPPPGADTLTASSTAITEAALAPLLHEILNTRGHTHLLPAETLAQMQTARKNTLARHLMFSKIFRDLRENAAQQNITILPLKGIHLADTAYPAPGTREMSDIDILVSRTHFIPAQQLLRRQGYTTALDFILKKGGTLPSGACFTGGPHRISIDLHHSLINTCGIKSLIMSPRTAEQLDTEALETASPQNPALSPPYFLLSLILHHYTHNFRDLIWHIDTALHTATMTQQELQTFTTIIQKFNLTTLAATALRLTAQNLNCTPQELFPALTHIIPSAPANKPNPDGRLTAAQSLMLIPNPLHRAAAVARFIFPSTYYLETVARRPISPATYIIELLKFQSRAIKR